MNARLSIPSIALERPRDAITSMRLALYDAVERAAPGPVHFAQVGANDGALADPLKDVLVSRDWRGVMVEPHPAYFADLTALHGARDRLSLVNCAVAETPGEMQLFALAEGQRGAYPKWARGCASLKRNRLEEVLAGARLDGGPVAEGDIDQTPVKLRRLDGILEDHRLDRLDLLVVDVEGFEQSVLASADFARLGLMAAIVECNGSDQSQEGAVAALLARAGLQTFRLRDDLYAMHPARLHLPFSQFLQILGRREVLPQTNDQP